MKPSYTSFLICSHETHAGIYLNGLPIGILKQDKIEWSKSNPLNLPDSKFKNLSELKEFMISTINQLPDSWPDN